MIRVGYIAGEPNPSRAPHLDRIAEHPEIDLTVIYAAPTVHRREWFARKEVMNSPEQMLADKAVLATANGERATIELLRVLC